MSDLMLSAKQLSKRFGGLWAVKDANIEVQRGQTLSIIGPNGAGKTTLFNLLSGQLEATKGQVLFEGRDVTTLEPHQRARLGLGRTFQIMRPLAGLTVFENVLIGSMMHTRRRRASTQQAWAVLERVGLAPLANSKAGGLTLAKTKRLEVARALATEPNLLLLDEVMAGLNAVEVGRAIDLFQKLNAEGLTIVLIEHNLKVVRAFAEHVVVLDHGEIIATGSASDVLDDPVVIEAYLGQKHQQRKLASRESDNT